MSATVYYRLSADASLGYRRNGRSQSSPPAFSSNEIPFPISAGCYSAKLNLDAIALGTDSIQAIAGSFILIPRETPHTFDNASEHPSRMLTIFSPPGFEQFFPQVAALPEPAGSPEFLAAVQTIRRKLNTELATPEP